MKKCPISYWLHPFSWRCFCKLLSYAASRDSYVYFSCCGLYHCYQTKVTCARNLMLWKLLFLSTLPHKILISSSLCVSIQFYKRLKGLGENINSYPVFTMLFHVIRSLLFADQMSQSTSWNISEQLLFWDWQNITNLK